MHVKHSSCCPATCQYYCCLVAQPLTGLSGLAMRLCVVAYSEARWRKVESSGHFSYLQGNGKGWRMTSVAHWVQGTCKMADQPGSQLANRQQRRVINAG